MPPRAGPVLGRRSTRVITDGVDEHPRPSDGSWREDAFFRRRPSAETLAWVAAVLGPGAWVVGHRRLTGGVNSAVHRLTVERHDTRTSVVLRQYPAGSVPLRTALEQEIAKLEVVAGSDLPVPRILAVDLDGRATGGAPSLLMTRLPGHVHLDPTDHRPWIARIAEFAARLHATDLTAPAFRPWTDSWITPLGRFRVPAGAQKPAVWRAAFAALEAAPPDDEAVFLHGDYLPVNLLWSRGVITGLTDWNGIHRGSRAVDLGQCRRYLAALRTPDWAEELRLRYESITGTALHPWWDLYALLHHDDRAATSITRQVAGRLPVDGAGMTARVEVVVGGALQRLG